MKTFLHGPSGMLRALIPFMFLVNAARVDAQPKDSARPDTVTHSVIGIPVAPYRDTLFLIHERMGSFKPVARAEAIVQRIKHVGSKPFFKADSLRIDSVEGAHEIMYAEEVIMSISARDANAVGSTTEEVALEYLDKITNSIIEYRDSVKWTTLVKEIALALLVAGLIVLLLRSISKAFRWSRKWLIARKGTLITGLKIKNYELFTADRSLRAVLMVNSLVRWLVVLLVLYLALPVLFGIFPWTQDLAAKLIGYVTRPLGSMLTAIWNFMPNLITIVVIFMVFRYAIKGIAFLRDEVERGVLTLPGFYPDWAAPTFHLLRIILYAFMLVVVFPYLPGSDSPVFQGVTVFLGALFTFGSAGSLSNVIAGLVLTYMRSFHIGDRVCIGDVTGDVIERTMLATRIRTTKNEIISIPNSTVMNSHTINFSSEAVERGLIVHSTVTIGYDVPWRQVHELLIEAAKVTMHIKPEPVPFVLQTSLDDFYVSYQINAYTDRPDRQATIYSDLHQHIQDRFNEAGVEIMSPHYRAARDGNRTTVPSENLPADYEAPSFRVRTSSPKDP